MKRCPKCEEDLPFEKFHRNPRLASGYQSYCKDCQYASYLKWKEKNPEKYKKYKKEHRERKKYNTKGRYIAWGTRKQMLDWLIGYLEKHPCVDCEETNILVLEFDHVNPEDKKFPVVAAVRGFSGAGITWDEIQEEIAKCEVRCSNCHAIRTAHQRGSWRLDYI